MIEAIFSFAFETICFAVGFGLLKLITFGRYRPRPNTNPFMISLLGLCLLIAASAALFLLLT